MIYQKTTYLENFPLFQSTLESLGQEHNALGSPGDTTAQRASELHFCGRDS